MKKFKDLERLANSVKQRFEEGGKKDHGELTIYLKYEETEIRIQVFSKDIVDLNIGKKGENPSLKVEERDPGKFTVIPTRNTEEKELEFTKKKVFDAEDRIESIKETFKEVINIDEIVDMLLYYKN